MNLALSDIRLAHPDDAAVIASMSRHFIELGLGWNWTPCRVLRSIEDRSSNVAVICDPDTVVGFGIMQYGDDVAHLALLAVRPEYRKQGLGCRLMSWLESPAVIAGIRSIRLEARADNPEAIGFYERRGYRLSGTVAGYYQGLMDAVRMEKPLHADALTPPSSLPPPAL